MTERLRYQGDETDAILAGFDEHTRARVLRTAEYFAARYEDASGQPGFVKYTLDEIAAIVAMQPEWLDSHEPEVLEAAREAYLERGRHRAIVAESLNLRMDIDEYGCIRALEDLALAFSVSSPADLGERWMGVLWSHLLANGFSGSRKDLYILLDNRRRSEWDALSPATAGGQGAWLARLVR